MAEYNPPPMIIKFEKQGLIKFEKDGSIKIGSILGQMIPLTTLFLQDHLFQLLPSYEDYKSLTYILGKIQGRIVLNYIKQRFGIKSEKRIMQMVTPQSQLVGMGIEEIIKLDSNNKHVIIKHSTNPLALRYRQVLGIQKEPTDHFLRGILTGTIETLFNTPMLGIEKECIAMGKPHCIFEIKEIFKWNPNDPKVKSQIPKKEVDSRLLKRLGSLNKYLI